MLKAGTPRPTWRAFCSDRAERCAREKWWFAGGSFEESADQHLDRDLPPNRDSRALRLLAPASTLFVYLAYCGAKVRPIHVIGASCDRRHSPSRSWGSPLCCVAPTMCLLMRLLRNRVTRTAT